MFVDCLSAEIAEDNFLLFTDLSSKILYQVDTNTEEFHALYIAAGESSPPENAVYNPQHQTVYWIERDKHQNEIWSMHLMKRIPELLIYLGPSMYSYLLQNKRKDIV